MHIEIHMFPAYLPKKPDLYEIAIRELTERVHRVIVQATVNGNAGALGKTTLLDNDDRGMILATIDIRKE